MKRLIFILAFGIAVLPAFSQANKCPFGGKGTNRNNQYSRASAKDVKQSQTAMSKQEAQFAKPKYHYIVYAKKPKHTNIAKF